MSLGMDVDRPTWPRMQYTRNTPWDRTQTWYDLQSLSTTLGAERYNRVMETLTAWSGAHEQTAAPIGNWRDALRRERAQLQVVEADMTADRDRRYRTGGRTAVMYRARKAATARITAVQVEIKSLLGNALAASRRFNLYLRKWNFRALSMLLANARRQQVT